MDMLIVFAAKYLVALVVFNLGAAWLLTERRSKIRFIATVLLAGILAFVAARLISHFFYNPRPFVTLGITPLLPHVADNGFPSDHALFMSTLTGATFFFHEKIALTMAVLTLVTATARVLAHIHSPLDIAGGLLIGASAASVSYLALLLVFRRLFGQKSW